LLDVFIPSPAARDGKKAILPQGFKNHAPASRGVGLGRLSGHAGHRGLSSKRLPVGRRA
jgi:hypothetical protein